jgi:hypothetical protein
VANIFSRVFSACRSSRAITAPEFFDLSTRCECEAVRGEDATFATSVPSGGVSEGEHTENDSSRRSSDFPS